MATASVRPLWRSPDEHGPFAYYCVGHVDADSFKRGCVDPVAARLVDSYATADPGADAPTLEALKAVVGWPAETAMYMFLDRCCQALEHCHARWVEREERHGCSARPFRITDRPAGVDWALVEFDRCNPDVPFATPVTIMPVDEAAWEQLRDSTRTLAEPERGDRS